MRRLSMEIDDNKKASSFQTVYDKDASSGVTFCCRKS
jgi:hypothetical protein